MDYVFHHLSGRADGYSVVPQGSLANPEISGAPSGEWIPSSSGLATHIHPSLIFDKDMIWLRQYLERLEVNELVDDFALDFIQTLRTL